MEALLSSPVFWVIAIIALIVLMYNNLNSSKQRVEKSFSNIDVYLQERTTKIEVLLDNAMNAANVEKELQTEIAALRSGAQLSKTGTINDKVAFDNVFKKFMATYENYPAFQSIGLFSQVSSQMIKDEEKISAARRQYNNNATTFNIKITSFPTNILAGMMRI